MKILGQVAIHVDNGGYTFKIQQGDNDKELLAPHIIIEDGYYGYSSTQLSLNENVTPNTLRKIGEMFLVAANKLENS